jgi:hypothetical protein
MLAYIPLLAGELIAVTDISAGNYMDGSQKCATKHSS